MRALLTLLAIYTTVISGAVLLGRVLGRRLARRAAAKRANILFQWHMLVSEHARRDPWNAGMLPPTTRISLTERSDADAIETLLTIASAVDPRRVGEP